MIEILSSGASNTVQDLGREGFLSAGVSRSGAMDREAMVIANRMIGNPDQAAGLEISIFPFRLKFLKDCSFAVTGAFGALEVNGQKFPSWWAASARKGDVLSVGLPENGARSYIALSGGLDIAVVLGSRSTDLKSGFGGLDGRGLRRGDTLRLEEKAANAMPVSNLGFGMDVCNLRPDAFGLLSSECLTLAVIAAAEFDVFSAEAMSAFCNEIWTVSSDANRQGYRLEGHKLALSKSLDLFSHGIMPGTVQVPPSGQPVIQLADANTCGGYPKIACVISSDLWKLAQSKVGQKLRFKLVNGDQAVEAIKLQNRLIDEIGVFAQLARRDIVRALHD